MAYCNHLKSIIMNLILSIISFLAFTIADDFTGTWAYTVNSPDGQVIKANFEFSQEDGTYTGKITSDQGELPLKDLKIEGNNMSCHFDYTGYRVEVKGVFKDDILDCKGSVEGYEFPMLAKKLVE